MWQGGTTPLTGNLATGRENPHGSHLCTVAREASGDAGPSVLKQGKSRADQDIWPLYTLALSFPSLGTDSERHLPPGEHTWLFNHSAW